MGVSRHYPDGFYWATAYSTMTRTIIKIDGEFFVPFGPSEHWRDVGEMANEFVVLTRIEEPA